MERMSSVERPTEDELFPLMQITLRDATTSGRERAWEDTPSVRLYHALENLGKDLVYQSANRLLSKSDGIGG
jgi:hypothetical protein